MPTNVIINGTFSNQAAGWSGNDIEANHQEDAYLGNGSRNRVAELDGNSGQTTVMEQTFKVDNPLATELTLDVALRNKALPDAGSDGFTVEILDASGNVIASDTVLPTTNSFIDYTLAVTFPAVGDYSLRFTEVGDDDSLGAIIDNVELLVCFAAGTMIATPRAAQDVADITPGDRVTTARGPATVRWVGRRQIAGEELAQDPKLQPVRIAAGALGSDVPLQDLYVSRQHRLAISWHGEVVLVAAIRLTALPGIDIDTSLQPLTYHHLLFDNHEILTANGAPAESLLLTARTLSALAPEAQDHLRATYAEVLSGQAPMSSAARIPPNKDQRLIVAAMATEALSPA